MVLKTEDLTERSSLTKVLPQILAVCVKNVLLLGFGMTLGFPTILIPSLSGSVPNESISLGQEAISWIGSINLICVPIGCLMSGSVTQPLGRKRAMQMVNLPFLTAWLLFHFATDVWQVFLALAITGLTGGLLEAPVLTYVAEITQPHVRGILSATSSMGVVLGVLLQFLLGTFLTWRNAALVNCAIPVISFILLAFVPETPVWLITRNRHEEARQSLAWLRGWTTLEDIEEEYKEMCRQIELTKANKIEEVGFFKKKIAFFKLFGKRNFIWPFGIVVTIFFLGQFNGSSPIQIYAISLFGSLKAPINKYFATVFLGIVSLAGSLICIVSIKFIGKRILTFTSLIGAGCASLIVATYAYSINVNYLDNFGPNSTTLNNSSLSSNPQEFHWVPCTFLILQQFFSSICIKILPWILIGEVFSNETRAYASGLAGASGYVFSFSSNKVFLSLVSSLTLPGVFWFYGIIGITGAVVLYFILPETEGKTLFEITEHFAGNCKMSNTIYKKDLKKKNSSTEGHDNSAYETSVETGL